MSSESVGRGPSGGRRRPILWIRRHTSRGGAFIAALLAARIFAFGCGPADGSQGGKCKDSGCHTYCDGNLVCDNQTNTCVYSVPDFSGPSQPVSECFESEADERWQGCAGQVPWSCTGSASLARACNLVSGEDAGERMYCCAPECTVDQRGACDAGTPVWCDDPLTPEDVDAGAVCVALGPSSFRAHAYCCGGGEALIDASGEGGVDGGDGALHDAANDGVDP
jgi:hypothetical protein